MIIPTKVELENHPKVSFTTRNNLKDNEYLAELKKIHLQEVRKLMKQADALILPGNKYDLDPNAYGEKFVHDNTLLCDNPLNFRLDTELVMASFAIKEQPMPLLGICGGMQLVNVLLGGSLVQDLPEDNRIQEHAINHCDPNFVHKPDFIQETLKEKFFNKLEKNEHACIFEATHGMKVCPSSKLAALYRENYPDVDLDNVQELSIHHQGLFEENLSPSLVPVAYAPDSLIEALEFKDHPHFALLTQFHVEYNVSRIANSIIQSLIIKG